MKNTYTHLKFEERFVIEKMFAKQVAIREIARYLDRSPTTISLELQRNQVRGSYLAAKAHPKARARRWRVKRQCLKVALDSFLVRFVEDRLKEKWSPPQISGYLKEYLGITCSAKAIYKFIDHRGLEYHLFWRWNKKKGGPKRRTHAPARDGRKYVDERPSEVHELGHLEVDFIVSKHSAWILMVVVDRFTKRSWVWKLSNRKRTTIQCAFSVLSHSATIKSITTDNDIAFTHWRELETIIQAPIYFCHPYHSWEKGLVENTNRWVRCFVPKRRDIASVTQDELDEIHHFLNDRPRAVIGFRSPGEYYQELTGVLLGG